MNWRMLNVSYYNPINTWVQIYSITLAYIKKAMKRENKQQFE